MSEVRVALITGGSRGIGKEVAKKFAKQNYNIVINYIAGDIEEVKKELLEDGANDVIGIKADVSNFEQTEEMIKEAIEKFGQIDVLINNAGITSDNLLLRMKEEDFDRVIDINLKGVFNVTKHVIPYMMKKRSGRIVNIASVVGVIGNAGQTNYSASKAGVIGFTKSLAREVASRNILVNAVAPGFIETDMTDVLKDEVKSAINAQIPLKRMGTSTEVANVINFLTSEDSSYLTGQVINIDGGMVM